MLNGGGDDVLSPLAEALGLPQSATKFPVFFLQFRDPELKSLTMFFPIHFATPQNLLLGF